MPVLRRRLMGLDLFGFPIAVNYKSNPTHNTRLGTFFTICIYLLTLCFLFVKMKDMVGMEDPNIIILTKNMLQGDKDAYGEINMSETTTFIGVAI